MAQNTTIHTFKAFNVPARSWAGAWRCAVRRAVDAGPERLHLPGGRDGGAAARRRRHHRRSGICRRLPQPGHGAVSARRHFGVLVSASQARETLVQTSLQQAVCDPTAAAEYVAHCHSLSIAPFQRRHFASVRACHTASLETSCHCVQSVGILRCGICHASVLSVIGATQTSRLHALQACPGRQERSRRGPQAGGYGCALYHRTLRQGRMSF